MTGSIQSAFSSAWDARYPTMVGSQARVHYNSRTEKISISNSKSGDVFQNKIHPNCPIYANTCPSSLEFWKEITVMVESHDWSLRSFPHICNCSWSQPEVKASVEQGAGRGGSKLQEKLVWGSNYWSVKNTALKSQDWLAKDAKEPWKAAGPTEMTNQWRELIDTVVETNPVIWTIIRSGY